MARRNHRPPDTRKLLGYTPPFKFLFLISVVMFSGSASSDSGKFKDELDMWSGYLLEISISMEAQLEGIQHFTPLFNNWTENNK